MCVSNSTEGLVCCKVLGLNHEFESLCFARGSFYLYLFTTLSQYLIYKRDNNSLPDKGTAYAGGFFSWVCIPGKLLAKCKCNGENCDGLGMC